MIINDNLENIKTFNNINKSTTIKEDIENIKSEILNNSETILKENEINDPKIKNKILLIKKYSYKHKDIFNSFIQKYPELYVDT
jgi:hypothetical protein